MSPGSFVRKRVNPTKSAVTWEGVFSLAALMNVEGGGPVLW